MTTRREMLSTLIRSWRPAVLAACLALLCPVVASAEELPCDDGTAPSAPQLLADPLPTLDVVSAGCDADLEAPAARFMVGTDGQTYYLELTRSTACAGADAELTRWIRCWTYEPARCGAEAVLQQVEVEISWPASAAGGQEPPCDRDTEVDTVPAE